MFDMRNKTISDWEKEWKDQPLVAIKVEYWGRKDKRLSLETTTHTSFPENHPIIQLFDLMPNLSKIILDNGEESDSFMTYHRPTDPSIVGE